MIKRNSTYKGARIVAPHVFVQFTLLYREAVARHEKDLVLPPSAEVIEAIVDTAFWASLRKEEGRSPKISLAFFAPELCGQALLLENRLPLTPSALTKIAPGFERPGVHLGIWEEKGELFIWGATHKIPDHCFILDVPEPGLLVVKHRRWNEYGKFTNVAVLNGDEVKLVEEKNSLLPGCPPVPGSVLLFEKFRKDGFANVLIQLAVSMRAHGRGGTLIIVPSESEAWLGSVRHPIHYAVQPAFSGLAKLMKEEGNFHDEAAWQTGLKREIDIIAGLTAIDGAIILNDHLELLAFGAKLTRSEHLIEEMIATEPVIDGERLTVQPVQTGGTRHLSAAQFVHDQRDSMALVASQDSRFTVFTWSECDQMVQAHRIESLLL